MEEATYELISTKLQETFNQGADLATMTIKNGAMMKIGQWQSHYKLKSYPTNHTCGICAKPIRNIQHMIECYKGSPEYSTRMTKIKVSLEILMNPYHPVT